MSSRKELEREERGSVNPQNVRDIEVSRGRAVGFIGNPELSAAVSVFWEREQGFSQQLFFVQDVPPPPMDIHAQPNPRQSTHIKAVSLGKKEVQYQTQTSSELVFVFLSRNSSLEKLQSENPPSACFQLEKTRQTGRANAAKIFRTQSSLHSAKGGKLSFRFTFLLSYGITTSSKEGRAHRKLTRREGPAALENEASQLMMDGDRLSLVIADPQASRTRGGKAHFRVSSDLCIIEQGRRVRFNRCCRCTPISN
ncbi:hypothetical protein SCHPADRAFT_976540 [Schizopora paradoxa]|uniref:Uncharacterized protein n=1 Tax=Schizopora paradoxa TaxID=27342 RepID=A0A0H2S1F3_9AGAM|nr:hypothetical protein SCHPADRAFT_976540 [Schizopora paradoxa]